MRFNLGEMLSQLHGGVVVIRIDRYISMLVSEILESSVPTLHKYGEVKFSGMLVIIEIQSLNRILHINP